jgi:hypothetical protein
MYHKQRSSRLSVVSQREISDVATCGSVVIGSSSEVLRSYILGKWRRQEFFARRYSSTLCEVSRFFNNEFGQDSNIVCKLKSLINPAIN